MHKTCCSARDKNFPVHMHHELQSVQYLYAFMIYYSYKSCWLDCLRGAAVQCM